MKSRYSKRLRVEQLEPRLMFAVGADFLPELVAAPSDFDGVVEVIHPTGRITSGALLHDGRHILTAAHGVDRVGAGLRDGVVDEGTYLISFDTTAGRFEVPVDSSRITLHPDWVANPSLLGTGDLAIIELEWTAGEGSHMIAPLGQSAGFDLYRETDEVGQIYTFVGYGRTGLSGFEGPSTRTGDKRISQNLFETDGTRLANEVQTIRVEASAGTFALAVGGETTVPIDIDADGLLVEQALNDLTTLAGNVSVHGYPGLWSVEFVGGLAGSDVPQLELVNIDLQNTVTAETVTEFPGNLYTAGDAWLVLDFDSGDAENDALGRYFGIEDSGLGSQVESFPANGDSGGPALLWDSEGEQWRIAGMPEVRVWDTTADVSSSRSTFGEIASMVRMSSYAGWVDDQLNDAAIDLVLDMLWQPEGDDGTRDRIDVRDQGENFTITVNGSLIYNGALADIASLSIYGSSDFERIRVSRDIRATIPVLIDEREEQALSVSSAAVSPDEVALAVRLQESLATRTSETESLAPSAPSLTEFSEAQFTPGTISPSKRDSALLLQDTEIEEHELKKDVLLAMDEELSSNWRFSETLRNHFQRLTNFLPS